MRMAWAQFGLYWRVPFFRRGLFLVLIAGLLLAFLQTQIRQPARTELEELRDRAIDLQTEQDNAVMLADLAEDYQRLLVLRDQTDLKFSASVEPSELVEILGKLSAQAGTRVLHGSNSFGSLANGVTPMLQDVTVEGNYGQIRSFLAGLSDVETLSLIRSVEMSANSEGTLVRAKIKIVTFNRGWN